MQLYNRLLREYPDFQDGDKVTFYLAHEQRELGQFDEMLKTLGELIRKYPKSPLRLEAEQIIGDYYFDKADLAEAEKHYQAISSAAVAGARPGPLQDGVDPRQPEQARRRGDLLRGRRRQRAGARAWTRQKALNVKREALLDLVYSYTEARPRQGRAATTSRSSPTSRATYALALDKLGNRYFIKQQYEFAIPALRKLMEIQPDPELDLERAEKIYDSLKAAKGKVPPQPEDIRFLVRAAVKVKTDPVKDEATRKKKLAELEELARDLATQLHVRWRRRRTSRGVYLEAAERLRASTCRSSGPRSTCATIMQQPRRRAVRRASATRRRRGSSRSWRATRTGRRTPKALETRALRRAARPLHRAEGRRGRPAHRLRGRGRAAGAEAARGEVHRASYPTSEHALEVKFNIARAYYDDGEYERSAELFTAFAIDAPRPQGRAGGRQPGAGRAPPAQRLQGHRGDGAEVPRQPAARRPSSPRCARFSAESKGEALGELALKSSAETGDVVEGLLKVAEENKGGEHRREGALRRVHRGPREAGLRQGAGDRRASSSPSTRRRRTSPTCCSPSAGTRPRRRASPRPRSGTSRSGSGWAQDSTALDGWLAAGRLRMALNDYAGRAKDLEAAANVGGARKARCWSCSRRRRLKASDLAKAPRPPPSRRSSWTRPTPQAAAVLAEVAATPGRASPTSLAKSLAPVTNGPDGQGEDTAKALWYLGEMLYRNFKAIPGDQIDQKVAALQQLQGVYTQSASMGSRSGRWPRCGSWACRLPVTRRGGGATPVPAGLSAAEAQQFRTAVKQQVEPLKEQADEAFKTCLSRASQLEVFAPAVLGCRSRSETARSPLPSAPAAGQPAHRSPSCRRRPRACRTPPRSRRWAWRTSRRKQIPMAQLALARATELGETRASAHNALGVALLYQGEPMAARAAYGKALDADPTNEKARANLAALRCRYGDQDGARKELSELKDGALAGADVDPEWRTCR